MARSKKSAPPATPQGDATAAPASPPDPPPARHGPAQPARALYGLARLRVALHFSPDVDVDEVCETAVFDIGRMEFGKDYTVFARQLPKSSHYRRNPGDPPTFGPPAPNVRLRGLKLLRDQLHLDDACDLDTVCEAACAKLLNVMSNPRPDRIGYWGHAVSDLSYPALKLP